MTGELLLGSSEVHLKSPCIFKSLLGNGASPFFPAQWETLFPSSCGLWDGEETKEGKPVFACCSVGKSRQPCCRSGEGVCVHFCAVRKPMYQSLFKKPSAVMTMEM